MDAMKGLVMKLLGGGQDAHEHDETYRSAQSVTLETRPTGQLGENDGSVILSVRLSLRRELSRTLTPKSGSE